MNEINKITVAFLFLSLGIIFVIYETSFHFQNKTKNTKETQEILIKKEMEEKIVYINSNRKLKIAVVAAIISLPYGDISIENFKKYCSLHNYSLHIQTDRKAPERAPHWEKIIAMKEAMMSNNFDYIFWMDADSLFMNMSKKLDDLILDNNFPDMIMTGDMCSCINSGHLLVRNSWWSYKFFDDFWNSYPVPKPNWADQTAMYLLLFGKTPEEIQKMPKMEEELCHETIFNEERMKNCSEAFDEKYRDHIVLVPQRAINSYVPTSAWFREEEVYQPGDFIIHFTAVEKFKKHGLMKEYKDKITF
ncbi:alpha-16-mannosyltransferase mnn11-related [Anaeramoeba ignava]|uniref:Alpha-16-mannosyltransferase mnn11-related n=1 Tax=Anaeramoeba ignava TaxID=1746090 RepID=A0A9Q0LN29_ANAIG|nr:alpha-16-mannosyltransferase mnn11-related [Anaeramoeba ignava]